MKEYQKEWRKNNPDKIKGYYEKHKPKNLKRNKAYREANKQVLREKRIIYYAKHRDEILAKCRERYHRKKNDRS